MIIEVQLGHVLVWKTIQIAGHWESQGNYDCNSEVDSARLLQVVRKGCEKNLRKSY